MRSARRVAAILACVMFRPLSQHPIRHSRDAGGRDRRSAGPIVRRTPLLRAVAVATGCYDPTRR
ncbi:hypothetical protein HJD18_01985 [Thermoleophilia bacterium SCSIO 60948]|nr:hypothetical protein HJD18_01985 [Thermoleophilia bacterium SCSIO 60948]